MVTMGRVVFSLLFPLQKAKPTHGHHGSGCFFFAFFLQKAHPTHGDHGSDGFFGGKKDDFLPKKKKGIMVPMGRGPLGSWS